MPQTKQKAFDLTPGKLKGFDDYKHLARWLSEEIQNAEDVRGQIELQLDYWHRIYEQDRTRLYSNRPKPDGADLTSPLGTQYVDSLHARTMQTIFGVEPIWTVEGWADSVQRAPFVEEFHQWNAEDERIQGYCDRAIANSWVDAVGVLECYEETDYQPVRKTIWAQVETAIDPLDPLQQPRAVLNERNEPQFVMDGKGKYVEVPAPQDGMPLDGSVAQVEIDDYQLVRTGPGYAVIDHRDFYVLPGHARDRRDIWGYAKRFYRRYQYLQQKAKDGMYDKKAVESLGDDNERDTTLDDTRRGVTVARQEGPTAEKELYEVAVLLDLDGTGPRWWVATVHKGEQVLLRLKYDDLGTQIGFGRFVRFVPFPRKNSVDGFSVIGHKLITLIEEHTAVRNMRADLAALVVAAAGTMKVMRNALYDPEEQALGVGSAIYVNDVNEVQQLDVPQMPPVLNEWERSILDSTERTIGVTDIASGVTAAQDRTLGERELQTGFSEVRMNLVVKRQQEAMEELGQIRHVIWKRTLANQGEMPMPHRIQVGLENRGYDVSQIPGGMMTAQLLDGKFKFKPRGSVETADLNKRRQDFVMSMQALPPLLQTNPMIAAMMATPDAARAFVEMWINVFRIPDKQAFLGMPGQMAGQTQQLVGNPMVQQLMQQFSGGGSLGAGAMGPAGPLGGGPAAPPPMPEQMGGMVQ